MWIKICANTTLEDALMAVEAGADAVGFVFAPSMRRVAPLQVAAIVAGLPEGIETVGVFATGDANEILDAVEVAGLNTVQLHGGVKLELARELAARMPGLGIILTLSWQVDGGKPAEQAAARDLSLVAAAPEGYRLLVDSKVGGATGGTGVSFDWPRAQHLLTSHPGLHVIVAGGLRPENVAEAVLTLKPWGVDVASGVELRAGVKDRTKVEELIRNARLACS
jgi:phosphoribosylanthranilate isomerase